MEKIKDHLVKLGLNDSDATVYAALFELKKGTIAQISQATHLNRTTIYPIIDRLMMQGLVSRASSKKTIFIPEHPRKLKKLLESKIASAQRRLKEADFVLEKLGDQYKTVLKPEIKVGHGKAEMEQIYNGVLEAKSDVFSILNLEGYSDIFDSTGKKQIKERIKKGVAQKVIAIDNKVARRWQKEAYSGLPKNKINTEYRWTDKSDGLFPTGEVLTFDDKVIVMLSNPEENTAYEVTSQSFANFLKVVFQLAWKQLEDTKN